MELDTYAIEAELGAYHWWLVGRRHLLSNVIRDLAKRMGATSLLIRYMSDNQLDISLSLLFNNA